MDMAVNIHHKIYSMQRILIHIKANSFVKYGHLHPEYAANLVVSGEYYHCHWILLRAGPDSRNDPITVKKW